MYQETGQVVRKMRVDGGVCRNDFLMQLISDLTMVTIDRPVFTETASQGAAMMAGLQFGKFISISNVMIMLIFHFIHRYMEIEERIKIDASDRTRLYASRKPLVS